VYYDFSGYSDMAIGLGTLFGFRIPENFNYPLISRSIGEFWRRWHISLSTWFKEYLYIPLGGNRSGELRACLNLFIVFLVTGFWHGASWNMVLWGAWHGMFIVFERLTRNWWKREHGACVRALQHVYVMTVFVAGFAIFLPEGLKASGNYIKAILGLSARPDASFALGYYIGIPEMVAFAIALICCMPVFKGLPRHRPQGAFTSIVLNGWFVLLFVLSFASMAASTYNPFIYFRF
jgi:alginate O-acetyltransferase complex protein AlgI